LEETKELEQAPPQPLNAIDIKSLSELFEAPSYLLPPISSLYDALMQKNA